MIISSWVVLGTQRSIGGGDTAWAVGPRKIDGFDPVLARPDHVSKASWPVQLQLSCPRNNLNGPIGAIGGRMVPSNVSKSPR